MQRYISRLLIIILPMSFLFAQTNIAVIPLEGIGVSTIEARVLTERLALELFTTGKYTVLERGNMEAILEEQDFQLSGCVTEECVVDVGALLGVESIVAGSVSKIGATFTIGLRLIDVETGELIRVASYDHRGAIDELLSIGIPSVARRLAGQDAIAFTQPFRPAIRSINTTSYESSNERSTSQDVVHQCGTWLFPQREPSRNIEGCICYSKFFPFYHGRLYSVNWGRHCLSTAL